MSQVEQPGVVAGAREREIESAVVCVVWFSPRSQLRHRLTGGRDWLGWALLALLALVLL